MDELKQEIVDNALYYQDHQRPPDQGSTSTYESWHRAVNDHFQTVQLPVIKSRGEKFVEYWPVKFLWGSKTEYKRGFVDTQTYLYKSGKFATGYICLSHTSFRLVALKQLTKEFPLVEGGARGFFSEVLQGMAGERDNRYAHDQDSVFNIAYESIVAVDVGPDIYNQYLVAIRIRTGTETWHVHPHFTDQEHEIEAAIRMGMAGELKAIWHPPTPAPKIVLPSPAPDVMPNDAGPRAISQPHTPIPEIASPAAKPGEISQGLDSSDRILTLIIKLKDLRDAGVITDNEFEEKKRELLSRL